MSWQNIVRNLGLPQYSNRPNWSLWERYGDSGMPGGMGVFSPLQWNAMQTAAQQVGPRGPAAQPAPQEPVNYDDWMKSLTTDYHNPLLDQLQSTPAQPLQAFDYGQGPSLLSRQSGRHGNGGGNTRNPTNSFRHNNALVQRLFDMLA